MSRLEFFKLFADKVELPSEATEKLYEDYSLLLSKDGAEKLLNEAEEKLFGRASCEDIDSVLKAISSLSGLNKYVVDFLFYAGASESLRERYAEKGIPENIFWDSVSDLKYKLLECREVHGIWGTFVGFWFPRFFTLDCFKLGRMEFEIEGFHGKDPVTIGGYTVNHGDPVLNFHIPSAGPMPRELREASYKLAYDFFPQLKKNGVTAFACASWLIYPENKKILPPHLNVVDFIDDFHIYKSHPCEKFGDAWRIFGRHHEKPIEELPEDTTQRRCFKKWLLDGNLTGEGFGVFFYDGEKFIK